MRDRIANEDGATWAANNLKAIVERGLLTYTNDDAMMFQFLAQNRESSSLPNGPRGARKARLIVS